MKYRLDKQDSFAVLSLDEDNLNSALAPHFKSDLIILNNEGIPCLILDLTNVKFVDSSGLSAILTGHRLWKQTGGFIIAGDLQPMVKKLIEISKLDSIFLLLPTVNDAIDMVRKEAVK